MRTVEYDSGFIVRFNEYGVIVEIPGNLGTLVFGLSNEPDDCIEHDDPVGSFTARSDGWLVVYQAAPAAVLRTLASPTADA